MPTLLQVRALNGQDHRQPEQTFRKRTNERLVLEATVNDKPPMTWAVEASLAKLQADKAVMPRDAAAEALARRYAHDIDEAAVVSTQAAKVLRELAGQLDHELYSRIAALFDRIESTAVLAQLGPKLLAVLAELGMTPRARADTTRKGGPGNVGTPSKSPIGKLRAERMAGLKTS
jgi:hypothetical protein